MKVRALRNEFLVQFKIITSDDLFLENLGRNVKLPIAVAEIPCYLPLGAVPVCHQRFVFKML